MEIKTDAIVLRTADYKDADKIVTLLTPSFGKISASVKGVKRASAKLSFAAQPFAFCEYVMTQKSGRRTVVSAYQHDGFFPLRTDICRFYAACALAEACDALCMEGEESRSVFVAAAECLRAIAYGEERGETCGEALCSFLLTALFESGYMIDLDGCGACGNALSNGDGERAIETDAPQESGANDGERCYFDFTSGTFLCRRCGSVSVGISGGGTGSGLALASKRTYDFLRRCAGYDVSETLAADAELRALRLLKTYLSVKTERDYPCTTEFLRLYAQDR